MNLKCWLGHTPGEWVHTTTLKLCLTMIYNASCTRCGYQLVKKVRVS